MLEKQLHKLRRFYALRQKCGVGLSLFGIWRKQLKKSAKKQTTQNIILLNNGLLFPVDAHDEATYNAWLRSRLFPDLEWAINRYVKPDTIAIDIGANLGYVSILMAEQVGQSGQVISIEPNPNLLTKLKLIFWINGFSNYRIFQYGCSDKSGMMNFSIDEKDHTKSMLVKAASGMEVKIVPLDHIMEDVKTSVSFIKIDVEGHETEVLRGAIETIKRHRPVIVFESGTHHSSDQISQIQEVFKACRYKVAGAIYEWGIGVHDFPPRPARKAYSYNVLALPEVD